VNSTIYVTLNVAICIAVALPAAYAFSRYRFPGAHAAFFALLAFRVTPPVVLIVAGIPGVFPGRLLNTPVGIALVHCVFNVPIAIWILESFISAVPRAYRRNRLSSTGIPPAASSCASLSRSSRRASAPRRSSASCSPGSKWCFARTLTITDGKPITTAITSLFGFTTDIGLVMAMTTLSLVPGLAMIWFVRNHISRGFTIRV
jgi:glycerol transport system permease protein